MTEISNIKLANVNNVSSKKDEPVKEEKKDKSLSKTQKVLVGASALALIVVGGLLVKKGLNSKELSKQIETKLKNLNHHISLQNQSEEFTKVFDTKILQGHIDEALKLPKKERLSKLDDISKTIFYDRGFDLGLTSNAPHLKIDVSKLPLEVQQAIASKDQYRATKEYIKYCDNLFSKSTTAGDDIVKTVQNVFNGRVAPHSYDVSKEAKNIGTAQYGAGGYHDVTVNSENMVADWKLNHKHTIRLYDNIVEPTKNETARVTQTIADGKPVVTIAYRAGNRPDAYNAIRLSSNTAEFTPAQSDLLKLSNNISEEDVKLFKELTCGNYDATNYDAILSVIQSLASKIK